MSPLAENLRALVAEIQAYLATPGQVSIPVPREVLTGWLWTAAVLCKYIDERQS